MEKLLIWITRISIIFFILVTIILLIGSNWQQKQLISTQKSPKSSVTASIPTASPPATPTFAQTSTPAQSSVATAVIIPTTTPQLSVSAPTPTIKTLTLKDQVGSHNRASDCWVIIDNHVYDISNYFGFHPGGNSTMEKHCGRDATTAFQTKDKSSARDHSSNAYTMLEQYRID